MTVCMSIDGELVPIGGPPEGDPDPTPTAPPAVIILSAIAMSPTQLRVTWLAPTWDGGSVSYYQVDLDGEDYNWSLTGSEVTISDLQPDTEYTIAVRAVSSDGLIGPSTEVSAWTLVQPVYDEELGAIGDRPALTEDPSLANTGPRQATTQSMTGPQALAAVLAAPVEGDGKRYLRRVNITSPLRFNETFHNNLVFEDCVVGGSGVYVVRSFYNEGGVQPAGGETAYNEFRYCEINGGHAQGSAVRSAYVRFLRCHIHHGVDNIKDGGDSEFYACLIHDTYCPEGAHTDTVQITGWHGKSTYHWNTMLGFNSMDSPSRPGGTTSGLLQSGPITSTVTADWFDNYFDGGHYTLRCGTISDRNGNDVFYTFRRNRFGRGYMYGPLYGMSAPVDFDSSNVWADTGLPVQG